MAFATIDDLAARFGRALTGSEEDQAEVMLEDASFLLSVRAPGLVDAVDGGDETITTAAMLLTVAMVKRALQAQAAQQTTGPGVDSIAETFGPYSHNIKYRADNGNLFLYGTELDYLLALLRGDMADAVSMRSPGL